MEGRDTTEANVLVMVQFSRLISKVKVHIIYVLDIAKDLGYIPVSRHFREMK